MCGCLSHTIYGGTWPASYACALTGTRTSDPQIHRPALNPVSHTSRGFFFFLHFFQRERNINWGPSQLRSNQESNPQLGYMPWPGMEPATFPPTGGPSNQLSLTRQNELCIFLLLLLSLNILFVRLVHDISSNNLFISLLYSILLHEFLSILLLTVCFQVWTITVVLV